MGVIYGNDSSVVASRDLGNISFKADDLVKTIQAHGIFERRHIEWYDKFNRLVCLDPQETLGTTKEFIFMTKPDLNLLKADDSLNDELSGIPFFEDAHRLWKDSMRQLQISNRNNVSPFINLVTNGVTSSLDLSSIDSETIETSKTYQDFGMIYRDDSFSSDFFPTFNLEFEDTKYLEIYMMFRIYDEYERAKKDGIVHPPGHSTEDLIISPYTLNRELHDVWDVYKFTLDDDFKNIIHYAKIWGVTSLNVPRDVFGNLDDNGHLKFSINFKGIITRDMDPIIIRDFNNAVGIDGNVKPGKYDIPLYDKNLNIINNEWCRTPYINTYNVNHNIKPDLAPMPRYELRWR